jgi:hypothetical protein
MNLKDDRCRIIFGLLILSCGLLLLPANSLAERSLLTNFSFDDCDPFEAQAIIMDVLPGQGQLIAAEQIIYVVDMPIGGRRLTTELTDASGRYLEFGSFRQGQWIHIEGFKHIDGGVVASWIQKIDPPEIKIPVLRKLIHESPPDKRRITRRVGAIKK